MRLDRALRTALRNFSTLFLVVALVTVPLNIAWAFAYRDVIATQPLHEDIRDLPAGWRVRGVDGGAIDEARIAAIIVVALQAALLPLALRAVHRTIADDQSGRVPTALGAWRSIARRPAGIAGPKAPGVALATIVFAAVVWWLAWRIGALVTEPLPAAASWLGEGLVRGLSPALALPFALVGVVEATGRGAAGVHHRT